ncbi:MAG: hypothetical protein JW818_05905 [Pirellulales bacterium]|nr:hypothetical protein [Pirellulales bacterium]
MKPILQALVVADHVYQDVTGKKIIAGTFNRILFKKNEPRGKRPEDPSDRGPGNEGPSDRGSDDKGTGNGSSDDRGTGDSDSRDRKGHRVPGGMHSGSPYAYISLTDVVDGTELTLQFVNLNKNVVLFQTDLIVRSEDRLKTIEIVAPLPPLPITEEGVYAFEVVWQGVTLGSHRILGQEMPDPGAKE